MLPTKCELVLVRLDLTNEGRLLLGATHGVPARDATPVPHLQLLAVLDPACSVILYSGPVRIGKVYHITQIS